MTIQKPALGLVLPIGPVVGEPSLVLDSVEQFVEQLDGHVADLWVTDHLQWGDASTLEAWTTLSFAAARWPQLGIGTVVLSQSYRNPGLLSKMATTLQALSGGRLILGLGAGWKQDEYDAYGYPFPPPGRRVDELEDTLAIITKSWDLPGAITHIGGQHQVTKAVFAPRPTPRPPILVGGGGRRTLRLVARYADWWNIPDCTPATYALRLAELHRACDERSRDPSTIRLGWFGRLAIGESRRAAIALSEGKWTPDNAIVGHVEEVGERIQAFADLGVTHFALEVIGLADPATAEQAAALIRGTFAKHQESSL